MSYIIQLDKHPDQELFLFSYNGSYYFIKKKLNSLCLNAGKIILKIEVSSSDLLSQNHYIFSSSSLNTRYNIRLLQLFQMTG